MKNEDLKKRFDLNNLSWKLIKKYSSCKGSETDCNNLISDIDKIYADYGEIPYTREIMLATANEIDRIMTENSKN